MTIWNVPYQIEYYLFIFTLFSELQIDIAVWNTFLYFQFKFFFFTEFKSVFVYRVELACNERTWSRSRSQSFESSVVSSCTIYIQIDQSTFASAYITYPTLSVLVLQFLLSRCYPFTSNVALTLRRAKAQPNNMVKPVSKEVKARSRGKFVSCHRGR